MAKKLYVKKAMGVCLLRYLGFYQAFWAACSMVFRLIIFAVILKHQLLVLLLLCLLVCLQLTTTGTLISLRKPPQRD